jgi:hypothetical protein
VRSHAPDVARDCDCRLGQCGRLVLVRKACGHCRRERCRQLLGRESHQGEIGAQRRKVLELQIQHLEVPAGIERDPVIRQHQLAPLQLGQPA